jgi:hypothetical protein
MDCFLLFNILDHICTTCFVFANLFGKSFQSLLQIVKVIWIRLQEAFSRFEIPPLFQMLFLWLNKTPPEWNSPLSFQEGFNRYQIWKYTIWRNYLSQDTNWKTNFCDNQINLHFDFFLKLVVRSFCCGLNIFSPFGINRQKWRRWEPFLLSPPLVQVNMSENIIPIESVVEWQRRIKDTGRVEWKPCLRRVLHFPFNLRLSIEIHLKTH